MLDSLRNIEGLKELIDSSQEITLISHRYPDGDAIGSLLGMYHYLKEFKDKEVHMLVPDGYPDFLSWMPSCQNIINCELQPDLAKRCLESSDVIYCLDFNHTSRVSVVRDSILNSSAKKVLIDHHPNPEGFADLVFSETSVSSTSELLYYIITGLGGSIGKYSATCLFVGIMTDTGGFSHNSSNPGTYEIIANLLKTGIDKNDIFDKIYNNFTADRMRLMGYCLHEKMRIFPQYNAAFISLSKEEMEKFNFQTGDTEGFVNLPLSVKGIVFSALFLEKDDMIKVSFRSKGKFKTNIFSKNHFNGGGHMNASGGESYDSLDETLSKFISLLDQYNNELTAS